jgi:hypothetical protein
MSDQFKTNKIKALAKIYIFFLVAPLLVAIFTGKEHGRFLLFIIWPAASFLYSLLYWLTARKYDDEVLKLLAFSRQNTPAILLHLSLFICVISLCFIFILVKNHCSF